MTGRGVLAAAVLAAWGAGIAAFASRELSRSPREKLAEAAARIAPGATYFAVERQERHVGFFSTTIDTIPGGLQATDYIVADVPAGETSVRSTRQVIARFSRALVLRDFTITSGPEAQARMVSGKVEGDSLLRYVISAPGKADMQREGRLNGPLLFTTQVPLAMTLGDAPKAGLSRTVSTFDSGTLTIQDVKYTLTGESTFVLVDSAAFDAKTRRWAGVHADTVHGWHLTSDASEAMDAWIDDLGRLISQRKAGDLNIRRTAYEIAFENWRTASVGNANLAAESSLGAPTALTAKADLSVRPLSTLRVRFPQETFATLDLASDQQIISGDTVTVMRGDTLVARESAPIPPPREASVRYARELRAEPSLEVEHPAIATLAKRLRAGDGQSGPVIARILRWVHDSIAAQPAEAPPSALGTLRLRHGDCDEHTVLFVALARAAGVPARAVSGMLLINGKAYYHSWSEVMLGDWVPVDPTTGQLPVDASHIRMLNIGPSAHLELARVIGRMRPTILAENSPAHARAAAAHSAHRAR